MRVGLRSNHRGISGGCPVADGRIAQHRCRSEWTHLSAGWSTSTLTTGRSALLSACGYAENNPAQVNRPARRMEATIAPGSGLHSNHRQR
jgi:hypothetical protein